jgi:hypothetical protein
VGEVSASTALKLFCIRRPMETFADEQPAGVLFVQLGTAPRGAI